MTSEQRISRVIRDAFVIGLREAFKLDPDYPFVQLPTGRTDIDHTIVEIIDIDPIECAKFPAIIVSSFSERGEYIFFEDDLLRVVIDPATGTPIKEIHGDPISSMVTMKTYAFSSMERDDLIDKTHFYLKTFKNQISGLGIEMYHPTILAPSQETIGTRIFFSGTIEMETYNEWSEELDVDPTTLITKFKMLIT